MIRKNHCLFAAIALLVFFPNGLYAQSAQSPRNLSPGTSFSGNLGAGEEQWFTVTLSEAGMVNVETSGDTDTYLEVYDASFSYIDGNDDGGEGYNARLEIFGEAGKSYLYKLSGYSDEESGSYQIRAGFRRVSPTELRFGTSTRGNLSMGGDEWFSLRTSGAGIMLVETSGDTDTYLEVYDASYHQIGSDDDGGEDLNALLEIFCEADKTYLIRVKGATSSNTGSYRIWASFDSIPLDTERNTERSRAVSIRLGEAFPIVFYAASESRWYSYNVTGAGITFMVQTRGNLDTLLFLYDDRGNLLFEDDDSGDGRNALISVRLNPGTVYIEVKEYDGNRGRCTLHAETR